MKLRRECYVEHGLSEAINQGDFTLVEDYLAGGADPNQLTNMHVQALSEYKELLLNAPCSLLPNHLLRISVFADVLPYHIPGHEEEIEENMEMRDELIKNLKTQRELINAARHLGADVNFKFRLSDPESEYDNSLVSILDFVDAPYMFHLLSSCGAKCSDWNHRYITQYLNQKNSLSIHFSHLCKGFRESLDVSKKNKNKIPFKVHYIWLTSNTSPKPIKGMDISRIVQNKNFLDQGDASWIHTVWVRDVEAIKESVYSLETQGISVRSIYNSSSSLKLFDHVEDLCNRSLFGMAKGVLSYSVLDYFGGLFSDLDMEVTHDLTHDFHRYDFMGDLYSPQILAARPQHPITSMALEIYKEDLESPDSITSIIGNNSILLKTMMTDDHVFGSAALIGAHMENNIDLVSINEEMFWGFSNTEFFNCNVTIPNIHNLEGLTGVCGEGNILGKGGSSTYFSWADN